jgi:hypothetical protein
VISSARAIRERGRVRLIAPLPAPRLATSR